MWVIRNTYIIEEESGGPETRTAGACAESGDHSAEQDDQCSLEHVFERVQRIRDKMEEKVERTRSDLEAAQRVYQDAASLYNNNKQVVEYESSIASMQRSRWFVASVKEAREELERNKANVYAREQEEKYVKQILRSAEVELSRCEDELLPLCCAFDRVRLLYNVEERRLEILKDALDRLKEEFRTFKTDAENEIEELITTIGLLTEQEYRAVGGELDNAGVFIHGRVRQRLNELEIDTIEYESLRREAMAHREHLLYIEHKYREAEISVQYAKKKVAEDGLRYEKVCDSVEKARGFLADAEAGVEKAERTLVESTDSAASVEDALKKQSEIYAHAKGSIGDGMEEKTKALSNSIMSGPNDAREAAKQAADVATRLVHCVNTYVSQKICAFGFTHMRLASRKRKPEAEADDGNTSKRPRK
jgi:chromosome segregation ATPase